MSTSTGIREIRPEDQKAVLGICAATGLFEPEELEFLEGMLGEYFAGNLGADHHWIMIEDDGIQGAAYYAPEDFADRVWNLYFIGIHPDQQGQGVGTRLLRYVEETLTKSGQRILIIETSSLGTFEQTRSFYKKNGYDEEARIRGWYKDGDDKVIFRKSLTATA